MTTILARLRSLGTGLRSRLSRRFALYPDSEPMAPTFRAKQLQAVLRMTPLNMAVNLLNALLVGATFWDSANRWFLTAWVLLVMLLAVQGLRTWHRNPSLSTVSRRALRRTAQQAALLALLWGGLIAALFGTASRPQQLLLATLVTGMMSAGGFSLATVPMAGTVWVAILTAASFIAIMSSDFPLALPVGSLLFIYGFIVSSSIWSHARTFCARLIAEAHAETANRAKSLFLSSMSHELRTPLNAVLGYAQLLGMDPQASQNTRQSAAEIETAGKHLLALVNDILDLARIESGRLEINIQNVALAGVLTETRRTLAPQAQTRGLTLDVPELQVLLRADPVRLRQVLFNLISNAIKYNRDGGQVSVHGEPRPARRYRLTVRDTGHGIPAERMGELFQPFQRIGAEHSNVEGTGIGLVITRNLVEAMQGMIGVESTAGEGSVFWVELPLADDMPQPG